MPKIASTKLGGNNKSLIQETLKSPSIAEALSTLTVKGSLSWITPIIQYLRNGTQQKTMVKEACYYIIIEGQQYRRGLSQQLLKCLSPDRTSFVLQEVHEGSCSHHLGEKALALKVL